MGAAGAVQSGVGEVSAGWGAGQAAVGLGSCALAPVRVCSSGLIGGRATTQ